MNHPSASPPLDRLIISGFKSIAHAELNLGRRTVLIGGNGSGKSNVLSVFHFMRQVVSGRLQTAVNTGGKADAFLHFGRQTTATMSLQLECDDLRYAGTWVPTDDNRLIFADERLWWRSESTTVGEPARETSIRRLRGMDETAVTTWKTMYGAEGNPIPDPERWRIFHFHDTGQRSEVKRAQNPLDFTELRDDGRNLAPVLRSLRATHPKHYASIIWAISLAFPRFEDFILEVDPVSNTLELAWREKGSDYPFRAFQLSDGTLRFMCLATLLLLPPELLPPLIILDEPELGLHPLAISLLAEMIHSASVDRQVIIATQSPALLDAFDPTEVAVVERTDGATTIQRPDANRLRTWLEEYTLGQVWNMNLLGGRP